MSDLTGLRALVPPRAGNIPTIDQLRERIMALEDESDDAPNSRKVYTTGDELRFIASLARKGRVVVLESLRMHCNTRRWDIGIDIPAVNMAILSALSALETERQRLGGSHGR